MKKIFLLSTLIGFVVTTIQAQLKLQKPERVPLKTAPVKTTPPPAPVTTTRYYLSSARVTIFTGNDNKELPSNVSINLYRLSQSQYATGNANGTTLMYNYMMQGDNRQEFKPNSSNQVVLTNLFDFPYTFPGGSGQGYRYNEIDLEYIQLNGLRLAIGYSPNFILDAWKIDKVIMTLEFKDLQGNPHPTLGSKAITFMNASALLKDGNNTLTCDTDKFLMPKN